MNYRKIAIAGALTAGFGAALGPAITVEFDAPLPPRRRKLPPRNIVMDGTDPIVTDPAVLAIPSEPYVGDFGAGLKELTERMFAAMYATGQGVGLAAVQIGVHLRVCVVDVYGLNPARRTPRVFVNPVIFSSSGKSLPMREGCLSAPGKFGEVMRRTEIAARWHDGNGVEQMESLGGFLAHVIQHEIDHMDGIICTSKFIGGSHVS